MALPLLNVGLWIQGERYISLFGERSLPMAGGTTPPPEEDLAHSWFTVNWTCRRNGRSSVSERGI